MLQPVKDVQEVVVWFVVGDDPLELEVVLVWCVSPGGVGGWEESVLSLDMPWV